MELGQSSSNNYIHSKGLTNVRPNSVMDSSKWKALSDRDKNSRTGPTKKRNVHHLPSGSYSFSESISRNSILISISSTPPIIYDEVNPNSPTRSSNQYVHSFKRNINTARQASNFKQKVFDTKDHFMSGKGHIYDSRDSKVLRGENRKHFVVYINRTPSYCLYCIGNVDRYLLKPTT